MKRLALLLPLLALAAAPAAVQGRTGFEALSVEEMLGRYRAVDEALVPLLRKDNDENVISNPFAVFSAGWIHSKASVPVLLDLLCATNPVEPKSASWVPVSALDWADDRFPDNPCCKPYYVIPPTPASSALTLTPVPLERLEEEIEGAKTGSRRAELLAWVATARFGTNFLERAASKAESGNAKWGFVAEYTKEKLSNAKPFPMSQFRSRMPSSVADQYDNLLRELKRRIEIAGENGDGPETASLRAALAELGADTGETLRAAVLLDKPETAAVRSSAATNSPADPTTP